MKDTVVVDEGDAVLVCPKCDAQKVKELLQAIRKTGREDLL